MKFLSKQRPDVAVVDGILPDGASFSLIGSIRAAAPDAFIIGTSATPDAGTIALFMESGADKVIGKRDFVELIDQIRKVRQTHCPDEDETVPPRPAIRG
jgi:DNA-binding NarL/FixJ family response regulator